VSKLAKHENPEIVFFCIALKISPRDLSKEVLILVKLKQLFSNTDDDVFLTIFKLIS